MKPWRNQFGIGQYINHPPGGTQPNVFGVPYDFLDNTYNYLPQLTHSKEDHRPFIPNIYFTKPKISRQKINTLIQTVAIVARKDIEDGEELFLNYRALFPIESFKPDWYEYPDKDEATRRWAKSDDLATRDSYYKRLF